MNPGAPGPGCLTVTTGGRTRSFGPGARVLIGRAADCDVVLSDTRVSRRHVQLVDDDGWTIYDLDTVNGTWHEGIRLTVRPVGDGLALRLGDAKDGTVVELRATSPDAGTRVTEDLSAVPRDPVPLDGQVTIGRGRDNTVVLHDPLVSRLHARITRGTGGPVVRDLGSANLTFVNGDPVRSLALLRDGDVLTCGRTRFVRVGERLHFLPVAETGLVVDGLGVLPGTGDGAIVPTLTLRVTGGSLVAVIGPSGAGKSSLLRLLSGERRPAVGRVRFQSQDVHANAEIRTRIGRVPQGTAVHARLTTGQALRYIAELRLPMDADPRDRDAAVRDALETTGLAEAVDRPVLRLAPDECRRLAIGCELLTAPSLLLVDEPFAGLDPGQARSMMTLLRRLADAGRHVIVATREPVDLEGCDSVLVLAPGAQEAYYGPPGDLHHRFVSTDWADIFDSLARVAEARAGLLGGSPDGAKAGGLAPVDRVPVPVGRRRLTYQAGIIVRRQLRLLVADRTRVAVLAAIPLLVAVAALALTGAGGLTTSGGALPWALLVIVMGTVAASSYFPARDLVGERHVYRHERAAGLLPEAYLLGKVSVFGGILVAQSLLVTALLWVARPGPPDAVLLGPPMLEIAVALALTSAACCLLGTAISVFCPGVDAVRLAVAAGTLVQCLLCGGLIPVADYPVLAVPSIVTPARWGYAAMAATTDLGRVAATDALWAHSPLSWLLSLAMAAVLGAAAGAVTLWGLRR